MGRAGICLVLLLGGAPGCGDDGPAVQQGPATPGAMPAGPGAGPGAAAAGDTEPPGGSAAGPEGQAAADPEPAGSPGAEPAGDADTGTEPAAGGEGEPVGSSGDDDTEASAAPPICPDGPHAARPFEGESVTASEVCSGFTFTEGPVWVESRGVLLFSDFQIGQPDQNFVGRIVQHTPDGGCSEFKAGIGSNGLALDNDGKVLACRHDDQSLSTLDPVTGDTAVLVADYQGTAFSSPNDATMRSDGNLYFTDPAWQIGNRQELLPQRAYRRDPAGGLHVIDDIPRANGITLSPDETRLYVSDTGSVRVYALDGDGATGDAESFVSSGSDGMVVDCAGNLYITTDGLVRVHAPGGEVLGEIRMPAGAGGTTNVAFGGEERRTLFITTQQQLHAIELAIPGRPY